jgi:hypothetical protein
MPAKRKQILVTKDTSTDPPSKRQKLDALQDTRSFQHSVLLLYYPNILSLRAYVLSRAAALSKTRKRVIARLGTQLQDHPKGGVLGANTEDDRRLAGLLDTTLIGFWSHQKSAIEERDARAKDFAQYSQHIGSTVGGSLGECSVSQSEVSSGLSQMLYLEFYSD